MASTGKAKNKKKGKTVDLNSFLADGDNGPAPGYALANTGSSWADQVENTEVEDTYSSSYGSRKIYLPTAPKSARGPDVELSKIPNYPPFKAFLANVPYDVDESDIEEFFKALKLKSVKLPREGGGESGRLKGFAYAEFEDRQSLYEALSLSNETIKNRPIRIDIAGSQDNERERGHRMEDRPDRTPDDWRSAPREEQRDTRMSRDSHDRDQDYGDMPPRGDRDYGDRSNGFSSRDRDRGYGSRGYDDRDRYSGGRGGYDDRDRYSGGRGGYDERDRYSGGRGGYDDRRGGYDDRRGGYDDRRGGYDDRRGGYDDRRGGYDDRRGGYDDRRGGYDERRGGHDDRDRRGGFDERDRRSGYDDRDRRGGYNDRNDRGPSDRHDGYDRGSGDKYDRGQEDRAEDAPRERPRLQLQKRTVPVSSQADAQSSSSIFGGAKPVDTAAKERAVEEKLARERTERDRKHADTDASDRRRVERPGQDDAKPSHGGKPRRDSDRSQEDRDDRSSRGSSPPRREPVKVVPAPPPTTNAWTSKKTNLVNELKNDSQPFHEKDSEHRHADSKKQHSSGESETRPHQDKKPAWSNDDSSRRRYDNKGSYSDRAGGRAPPSRKPDDRPPRNEKDKSTKEPIKYEEVKPADFTSANKFAHLTMEDVNAERDSSSD